MIIAASFQRVLNEYIAARRQSFAGHAIASVLRDDLAIAIDAAINDPSRYLCTGSAGMGVWARGPWVGVFDRLVTTSAQTGIYPVYLFREDMTGVYLSLNQGMTEARERYGSDAKTALRAKAVDLEHFLAIRLERRSMRRISTFARAPVQTRRRSMKQETSVLFSTKALESLMMKN